VGTLAQALTREDEVERTVILNVIGDPPLTAEIIRLPWGSWSDDE